MMIAPRTFSYSGADARVFANFHNFSYELAELKSVQTVSWSVYEAKGPARALGHRSVKGYARGVRTIAGSMILTVVEDNPLRELLTMLAKAEAANVFPWQPGWSVDSDRNGLGTSVLGGSTGSGSYWGQHAALSDIKLLSRLITLIPPFNLSVVYVTEIQKTDDPGSPSALRFTSSRPSSRNSPEVFLAEDGQLTRLGRGELAQEERRLPLHQAAAWRLSGVEFITEGIVTSVNDTITEVTAQFVATDAYPITLNQVKIGEQSEDDLQAKLAEAARMGELEWQMSDKNIANQLRSKDALMREALPPRLGGPLKPPQLGGGPSSFRF